ncbi:class F sortase [Streptomyces griseoluteus]|uniref:class F sortase n=1 Tax=Streptomyces griseoluteus TaxID=29306 RepID=UPI003820A1A4
MSRPWPRRSVCVALWLALGGLPAAGVWAAQSRIPRAGSVSDFGAAPRSSAPPQSMSPVPSVGKPSAAASGAGGGGDRSASGFRPVPREVSIPRLGVEASVDAVGVTRTGQVVVPEDPKRVGWYRFSPVPGAPAGSSVIVGHVDSQGRGLGALVALNDVRLGDTVRVSRSAGLAVEYRVSRRTVAKERLSASGAFRVDGRAVLTLITCTSPYDAAEGGYQNNLVVTAEPVGR